VFEVFVDFVQFFVEIYVDEFGTYFIVDDAFGRDKYVVVIDKPEHQVFARISLNFKRMYVTESSHQLSIH